MGPPRSKKRRPTFRRLLKTSGVKLENKLKNRQLKQNVSAKKQRKEQKRLRQAVKGAVAALPPRPLETYCPRPDEEEEEDFLESLPTDMLEDDDLQLMSSMAQRASFITRDLSSCAPVHSGKKRGSEVTKDYEKLPRKMARIEQKEVIHLLPIKDKTGLIPQSIQKPVSQKEEEEEEEEDDEDAAEQEDQLENEGAAESMEGLTAEEREQRRAQKIQEKKLRIAALGSAVISDPISNVKRVKELRGMLMEADPSVAVTVRKLVMVSLMEIFKDVAPTYRIRPLTEDEKTTKVKKETQQLREFEEILVSQYKFYLEDLEQIIKDWKQQKKKRRQAVNLQSYGGLAAVAVRCLTELLLALPHFNFHNNIIVLLVPLMNDADRQVSDMCCDAFRKLFVQDKLGAASLATVRVISGLVKSLSYSVRPEVLQTLLSLRIREVKKDIEATKPTKKFMNYQEKKKNLSRMQRKWKKAEEKLDKELLEAEASENKEHKLKLHTETLNMVFLVYFRILKKAHRSALLPAVLEGLANFAHLINLEFFDDLLNVLQNLIQSGDLSNQESLHCIQTVFTILSGQGDVLNIDPLTFYQHLYRMLPRLHAGASNDDVIIVLRCLDTMLTRRKKQVTLQRAMAFVKRLSTLSLHLLPDASVGILAATRAALHSFPKCDFLLDNEIQGSGFYLPELDDPEHCNAQNTALWELHTLQRHYHPVVRLFAAHLSRGAPSEGSAALNVELSRRAPVELFRDYSLKDMTFNPPVDKPPTKKKDHFVVGDSLLDAELQKHIDRVLHTHTQTQL
ncbi:nucleolar complex protein 3 homolog [Salarias fasciatus]|uniref:Nucleolar complex protein 3 homolog n=1 Tax=Salarias fasciatus TaxID=181472 RepID=A0A672JAV9_SALFA|nr:nucleolar complex protein 3 homolog [Salarias fasciatus]